MDGLYAERHARGQDTLAEQVTIGVHMPITMVDLGELTRTGATLETLACAVLPGVDIIEGPDTIH